jgi:hypothetical protein
MLFWLTFFLAALAMVKATPTLTIRPLSCSTIFPTFWHLLNPSDSSLPNSVNPLFSDGSSSSGVMTIKQSNDGSTKPHPFSPKLKLSPAVSTLSVNSSLSTSKSHPLPTAARSPSQTKPTPSAETQPHCNRSTSSPSAQTLSLTPPTHRLMTKSSTPMPISSCPMRGARSVWHQEMAQPSSIAAALLIPPLTGMDICSLFLRFRIRLLGASILGPLIRLIQYGMGMVSI